MSRERGINASSNSRTLLACAAVTAAYYVSGRLGLLLAIPPGYATAVWPASGIALAAILLGGYRLWPGIWLGSFLINLWTGLPPGTVGELLASRSGAEFIAHGSALLDTLGVPALIALGAALQACLGAWLVRRFVGYSNLLAQEIEVVWILAFGGPVSCLLNATIGAGTLYLAGALPADGVLFTWWTWWVGDSIGVLVFAPLVLLWTVRPFDRWLRRQVLTTLPLLLVFALVVWLFVFVSGREQARFEATFDGWATEFGDQVRRDVENYVDVLYSVESFYESTDTVERHEFETFSNRMLSRLHGVQGLSWEPVVPLAQRAAFEEAVRGEGFAGFEIRERDAGGNLVRAAERAAYTPVDFIVPLAGNERALGFDIGSEDERRDALLRARDSGRPAATARIELVQAQQQSGGVVIFLPIYRRGAPHDTTGERQQNLRGYASVVFRVKDMLDPAIARGALHGVDVRTLELEAGRAPVVLEEPEGAPWTASDGVLRSVDIEVADRHWQAQLRLPNSYLEAHRSWQTWTLLAGGMLFTGLLGVFLVVMVGRNARIEGQIELRTAELRLVNGELTLAVARSGQLEADTRRRAEELAAINKELEQFAYAVSHDLQAPLRNIDSFSRLLERRYGEQLQGEGMEFLGFIHSCAVDMRRLIEDLLRLSRVTTQRVEMTQVSSAEALRAALDLLRTDLAAVGAQVEEGRLPAVHGDLRLLTQLFQNLVSNAIKFRRAGVAPRVTIGAEPVNGQWEFRVADNGIGIAAENTGKLFQVFKRLHTSEEYPGTGIGLALCRKVVQVHGGQIRVESVLGQGATFVFTLPIQAGK